MPNGLPVTEAATGPAMEALGDGGVGLSELEIEWLYVIPQNPLLFPNQENDYNMALQKMIVSYMFILYCFPLRVKSFEWRSWCGPHLDLQLHFGRSGWKEAHRGGPQDPCNIRLPVCNMQLLGQDHPSPPKKKIGTIVWVWMVFSKLNLWMLRPFIVLFWREMLFSQGWERCRMFDIPHGASCLSTNSIS